MRHLIIPMGLSSDFGYGSRDKKNYSFIDVKNDIVSSFWENMYSLVFVKEAEIFNARIVTTYFNGWQLLFVHGLTGL